MLFGKKNVKKADTKISTKKLVDEEFLEMVQFKEELKDELLQPVFEKPLIALFDTEASVKELLTKHQFSCTEATLGSCVRVPNDKPNQHHFLHLNYDYPENLHEYDIVILDMTKVKYADYSSEDFNIKNTKGKAAYAFLSTFPQKIFDSRPFAAKLVSEEIQQILKRVSVVIAFCGEQEIADYDIVKIDSHNTQIERKDRASIFDFYRQFPQHQNKLGKKLELPKEQPKIFHYLSKYLTNSIYKTVFEHPQVIKDNKWQQDTHFLPLLVNNNSEIVSFCHFIDKGVVFVFPDIENKTSFYQNFVIFIYLKFFLIYFHIMDNFYG
jgi:hypothetical protein